MLQPARANSRLRATRPASRRGGVVDRSLYRKVASQPQFTVKVPSSSRGRILCLSAIAFSDFVRLNSFLLSISGSEAHAK